MAPTVAWCSNASTGRAALTQFCIRNLPAVPDLLALHRHAPQSFPFLMASAARGTDQSRYSLLFQADDQVPPLVLQPGGDLSGGTEGDGGFLQNLQRTLELTDPVPYTENSPPFIGGWFVYLGYEVAGEIEPRLQFPPSPEGFPTAFAVRCPGAVIVDHALESAYLVAENPEQLDTLAARLPVDAGPQETDQEADLPSSQLSSEPGPDFERAVTTIRDYIAAGDVFQVNLSRGWRGRFESAIEPAALYQRLGSSSSAPFAGLACFDDACILSASPERLVEVRGRSVQTRPIAGTRGRGASADQDQALSQELITHPKERAEHIMLIDLERNDLGRVCEPGSVRVDELMVIESYRHVHHIVSNVCGRLRTDISPVDVLRAVFPGGTITGCPKVRCMEIIAELEQVGRGFYTGSMGYVSRDGQMDFNILIRSLWLRDQEFSFRTGAGIVADSVPERELEETVEKARGLLNAVGCPPEAA